MPNAMPINRLLVAVSVVYAAAGLLLLFLPEVVLARSSPVMPPIALWITGLLGGALFAFALLNWYQRHTMMGGIYGRPLLFANLMLMSNVAFSSLRMWRAEHDPVYAISCLIGAVFLVAFGRRLFVSPTA
jgi:hypothetical protein